MRSNARTHGKWITAVCAIVLFTGIGATQKSVSQTILYVDQSATGPAHDGWSWCSAFTDLQDAIDVATWDVVIRVADGTYLPDRGTGDQTASFQLKTMVAIEGGYAGCGAAEPNERNIVLHATTLSGDLGRNDEGTWDDFSRSENSFHVVSARSVDETAVLSGFTVSSGNASETGAHGHGGGLWMPTSAAPSILNCVFKLNYAAFYGGAVYSTSGHPKFVDCTINDNHASRGGGLYGKGGQYTLQDCTLNNNSADSEGGALYVEQRRLHLGNCSFISNTAESAGGAIYDYFTGGTTIQSCYFGANRAGSSGGAYFVTPDQGSFVYDSVFAANHAAISGGGVYLAGRGIELHNCSLAGNMAGSGRGLGASSSPHPAFRIKSCVLWDGSGEIDGSFSEFIITDSNIFGGWPGDGNIFDLPKFVDADGPDDIPGTLDDNLRLQVGSPCVDSGDPDILPDPEQTDYDGNPRVLDRRIDMGAFEFTGGCTGGDFDEDGVTDNCDGDIDNDGVDNEADVCDFTSWWSPVDSEGRPFGDVDKDCDVDLTDYATLQLGWSGP